MRELHVTSPLMRGNDVVDLQKILNLLGYSPGPVDGAYGPTTASALTCYLRDRLGEKFSLVLAGVCNNVTWDYLNEDAINRASQDGLRRFSQQSSKIGELALTEAMRHLGLKEDPPRSNRTPFGEWYGINGVKWCAIFVSYCFAVGGHFILCEGCRGAGTRPGKGCSYVPTLEAWLKATGYWVGRTEPVPGDIVIYNWDGGEPDHVGIVAGWIGSSHGEFSSIEGNTSVGDDSDGGQVMCRPRFMASVAGFGRIIT